MWCVRVFVMIIMKKVSQWCRKRPRALLGAQYYIIGASALLFAARDFNRVVKHHKTSAGSFLVKTAGVRHKGAASWRQPKVSLRRKIFLCEKERHFPPLCASPNFWRRWKIVFRCGEMHSFSFRQSVVRGAL